jgi:hypothetical protein
VKGLTLGFPAKEEDLFEKLEKRSMISEEMKEKLKLLRGSGIFWFIDTLSLTMSWCLIICETSAILENSGREWPHS